MNKTIAAIVVAYNRKDLLILCIKSLLNQTKEIDRIFIIDNASTDGTFEALNNKGYIGNPCIEYIRFPLNIGASGGIHEGLKHAYKAGYDFFWVMDDDAELKYDALSSLYNRITSDLDEIKYYCLYSSHVERSMEYFTEPVAFIDSGHKQIVSRFGEIDKSSLHEAVGGPFLGFLIPRIAIEKVGLPDKDTFIWGDSEYFSRLRRSDFRIFYDPKSILFHPKHKFITIRIPVGIIKLRRPIWDEFSIPDGPPFKQYYGIRNSVILARDEGRRLSGILWGAFRGIVFIFNSSNKYSATKHVLWALWDGALGRMVMRFQP